MEKQHPLISLIAAVSTPGRVIGIENRLPWHLPADLKHFKSLTLGKPLVMGRKTWESLPGLLPQRRHIVVTRNADYQADGAEVVHSLEGALSLTGKVPEVMIIGGACIYTQALPMADRIYLTEVGVVIEGDAWFPEIDSAKWREQGRESHPADDKNPYPFTFLELHRRSV